MQGELERLRKTSKRASELASENARLKAQLQECRLELQMMKEKEAAAQEALRVGADVTCFTTFCAGCSTYKS